ncbi:MAG: hypothetical protein KQH53_09580 [Desulfarculaceae bacterium]|nr:hypothetical protein [Desulfarculaceae bacterium]
MPRENPDSIAELARRVEAARAAAQGGQPPSPAELAALLAACRERASDHEALALGAGLVELILDLAREAGPQYLACLDREAS